MNKTGLVKIHVALPNHWACTGESFWATPLGDDLYELENIPFYAYGLNYKDIVKAKPSQNNISEIIEVIKSSGNKTFRINFQKHIKKKQQSNVLASLNKLHITWEHMYETFYALNVGLNINYDQIFNELEILELKKILYFESCEQKVKDSFDSKPEAE